MKITDYLRTCGKLAPTFGFTFDLLDLLGKLLGIVRAGESWKIDALSSLATGTPNERQLRFCPKCNIAVGLLDGEVGLSLCGSVVETGKTQQNAFC